MISQSAFTIARAFDDRQSEPESTWRDLATCREVGFLPFFPGKGESPETAKRICARCEVSDKCLAEVLNDPEAEGVWGGTTQRERRAIRKQRRAS
jgi:WhiB family redox-sensing transcriptional regulator